MQSDERWQQHLIHEDLYDKHYESEQNTSQIKYDLQKQHKESNKQQTKHMEISQQIQDEILQVQLTEAQSSFEIQPKQRIYEAKQRRYRWQRTQYLNQVLCERLAKQVHRLARQQYEHQNEQDDKQHIILQQIKDYLPQKNLLYEQPQVDWFDDYQL